VLVFWEGAAPAKLLSLVAFDRQTGHSVVVEVLFSKGVVANQRTATTTAATIPIGSATRFPIHGENALSGFHNASGMKSGEIGIAPK
jgi:hypothetical protein